MGRHGRAAQRRLCFEKGGVISRMRPYIRPNPDSEVSFFILVDYVIAGPRRYGHHGQRGILTPPRCEARAVGYKQVLHVHYFAIAVDSFRATRCCSRSEFFSINVVIFTIQISGIDRPRQIFFASLLGISVCRGTASISPVFGLHQSECSRPSLLR